MVRLASVRRWPRRLTPLALVAVLATYLWFWLTPAHSPDVFGGLPKVRDRWIAVTTHVLQNPGFAVGYNEWYRDALWVAFRGRKPPYRPELKRPDHFNVDSRTLVRVDADDYRQSSYDRGHLAPNFLISRLYGERAQAATFLMSNITPQTPRLNQLLWQRLEEAEADIVAPTADPLWIVTGPIIDEHAEKLPSGVVIPSAFYRIWLRREADGAIRSIGFIVPQEVHGDEPLTQFVATVQDIEARVGLDFFTDLPREQQDQFENVAFPAHWQMQRYANAPARYAEKFRDRN
jgi:endonuclease G